MPVLSLNSLLRIEQISSENDDSDDDPLALALCSLGFRFFCHWLTSCFIYLCRY